MAKRGSRFAGLDSMRKVREEGSLVVGREQPERRKKKGNAEAQRTLRSAEKESGE